MAKKQPLAYVQWTGRFQRDSGLVFPLSVLDLEVLERLAPGTVLAVTEHRPRTDRQNLYMRWLAQVGADNSPGRQTPHGVRPWEADAIIQQTKIDTGKFDGFIVHYDAAGNIISTRHNLRSSADFNLDEMKEFIDRLIDFILEICPGMDPAALEPKTWEERQGFRKTDARRTRNAPAGDTRKDSPSWLSDD